MQQHMETRAEVSRFGEPPEAELPDDIREIYEKNREKVGFVPNVFRAYARRPEHFRAFMGYHDVLMKGPSNLSRAEREAMLYPPRSISAGRRWSMIGCCATSAMAVR